MCNEHRCTGTSTTAFDQSLYPTTRRHHNDLKGSRDPTHQSHRCYLHPPVSTRRFRFDHNDWRRAQDPEDCSTRHY